MTIAEKQDMYRGQVGVFDCPPIIVLSKILTDKSDSSDSYKVVNIAT